MKKLLENQEGVLRSVEADLDIEFINYNFMSRPAKYCLDAPVHVYKAAGVSKINNNMFDIENMIDGDIIFVKTDFIHSGLFESMFLPRINKKFILVTGISDYSIDAGYGCSTVLDNKYLMKWFCVNPPENYVFHNPNSKLQYLPIGFQEKERIGGDTIVLNKHYQNSTPWAEKENKIYIPYHDSKTNREREKLLTELDKYDFCIRETNKLDFDEYLSTLNKYKYIVSLRGNGWDCHRHYESLLVGSVPILQNGPILNEFSKHRLPVISIDSVHRPLVCDRLFNAKYDFSSVAEFLTMEYHINKITTYRE